MSHIILLISRTLSTFVSFYIALSSVHIKHLKYVKKDGFPAKNKFVTKIGSSSWWCVVAKSVLMHSHGLYTLICFPAQMNIKHLSCNKQPLMGCVNTSRVWPSLLCLIHQQNGWEWYNKQNENCEMYKIQQENHPTKRSKLCSLWRCHKHAKPFIQRHAKTVSKRNW